MTETIQESSSAAAMTGKSEAQNSAAMPFEKATGMKPAHVMSVPVSMGRAVARKACEAALKRSSPSSSLTLIISTAMISSSTRSPREMMSAPKDTFCRSMPAPYMKRKTPVNTSGMQQATTNPVRRPSVRKLTASTMMTASLSVSTKSSIDSATTCGWSDT